MNVVGNNSEKASIWQLLKSNKIAVIASYLISKSVIGSIYIAVNDLENFKFLENRWELIFPIFNLNHLHFIDFFYFTLITLDIVLFSFLIKNILVEINKKLTSILAIGFLVIPILFKLILYFANGSSTLVFKQLKLEIDYIVSDLSVFLITFLVIIYKVSLCYILMRKFKSKPLSHFRINKWQWLLLVIPTLGYVYFFSNYLIYFISNYSKHIAKLQYFRRAWWIINIVMPSVLIALFFLLIQLVFLLLENLKEEKKVRNNYIMIIFTGIIFPLILIFFNDQVFKIITYVLNFLISFSYKFFV
jgi:hypothetical protein